MSNGDLRLHFVFSERFDMRTFNVNRLDADGATEVTLYKVFYRIRLRLTEDVDQTVPLVLSPTTRLVR